MLTRGGFAMWSVLAIGLFNSIMFPTIFTLAIERLGKRTSEGSGALCMAIVGGAILPVLMGFCADRIGIQRSFFVPAICYLYIVFYGLKGHEIVASPSRG
jgi:FHS family L-fucose permease-like MFS transporter